MTTTVIIALFMLALVAYVAFRVASLPVIDREPVVIHAPFITVNPYPAPGAK